MNQKNKIAHLRKCEYTKTCELRFDMLIRANGTEEIMGIKSQVKSTDTVSSLIAEISNRVNEAIGPNSSNPIDAVLKVNGKTVNNTTVLMDFVKNVTTNSLTVTLSIFQHEYSVLINFPCVKQMRLPSVIYVGYPTQLVKLTFFNASKKTSKFIWYKSLEQQKWVKVGEGYEYVPTVNDGNHFLKVICVPFSEFKVKGSPFEVISEHKVIELTEFPRCPFEVRHQYTKQKLKKNELRIVTYNILADKYVDNIRYSYCSPQALGIHYRKQLILKEVKGYNADIICMQEVDELHFKSFFKEKMQELGYKAVFHRKGNNLPEGLACFFDSLRFKLLSFKQVVLRCEVERRKQFSEIAHLLNQNQALKHEFMKQNTSLQVIVLRNNDSNNIVIVGNTHLFYHPDANHIRLLQMFMETKFLYSMKARYLRENPKSNVVVLFCGDFNSDPDKSLYPAIINGTIDPMHPNCLQKCMWNTKVH
ncbi:2',5'-phosphodiesterase 12-like isoform X2 [Cylas formicarius]|uniref:2',5'-phosphodiesterase 12-like isoform X2 n=1 Tax=Cylas formicarius TaxID=197179 RepID=UPI0029589D55|nr:2',5'-phosphodiesterase 12-like isoform X2 [Cylas formicarius]